jgi:hypothetical protein
LEFTFLKSNIPLSINLPKNKNLLKTDYMQAKKSLNSNLTVVSFLKFTRLVLIILFIASVIFFISSCSKEKKNSSPEGQSLGKEEQSEKIPDELKEIEENIEKIVNSLDGPAVGIRKEENKDSAQGVQGDKGKDTEKKEGETNRESEKKDEKGDAGEQEKKDEKKGEGEGETNKKETSGSEGKSTSEDTGGKTQQKDPWEEITPIINKMHYTWNSYMPQAMKKGANQKVLDDFSNALNSLTNTIITKNKTNTLLAANYLYAYIPDLFSIYRTKSPSEIKRIRYYARNAMLNSLTANWTQAELDIDNLKSAWMVLRNVLNKESQDSINKLDLSITELDKVVGSKNQPLTDIKGRIALANIEEIEKSLEDTGGEINSQSGS